VVAEELVGREAEDHERQAGGRPAAAHHEREAFEGDHRDAQQVHRAGRQAADLRAVAVDRRQQRPSGKQQRERRVTHRDG
jgi:hypothetical protein